MKSKLKKYFQRFQRSILFIWNHPITKMNPIMGVIRYIIFHIYSVFSSKRRIFHFIENTYFLAKNGDAGLTGNVYCGLSDFETMAFILHSLKKNDLFIDVGANFGSYSILASGVKNSKSIAFEPDLSNFKILNDQIKLNNIEHLVTTNIKALGKDDKDSFITSDLGTMNYIITDPELKNHKTIKINMTTLDSINFDLNTIDMITIKIDVEGFEFEVLQGGKEFLTIEKLKAIIIETNGYVSRYHHSISDIHFILIANGFKAYSYEPFNREFELIEKPKESNTIYIRELDFIKERVNHSPIYKKFGVKF